MAEGHQRLHDIALGESPRLVIGGLLTLELFSVDPVIQMREGAPLIRSDLAKQLTSVIDLN